MITHVHIRFAINQKSDDAQILAELNAALQHVKDGPVFVIGSWQTGDFGHIYAAAVRHYTKTPLDPFSILVLQADGFGVERLLTDIEFGIRTVSEFYNGRFTLLHTDAISKNRAINAMQGLKVHKYVHEPYEATFWAKESVQSMTQGQPLTAVWGDIVRGKSGGHHEAYTQICASFMEAYIERFGISTGREKFVCLWGRTSGMPTKDRPLGGANPQYDSSEFGNQQLCLNLKYRIPSIKAILIVGDGFNAQTTQLQHVFNLGSFWKRQQSVMMGRFQENGFFDYMTAFYDCDVVHVGMKSGGMDVLGIWGQKVVFIDSLRSPEVTKARVGAWATKNLMPVPISEMPTAMGKAIEIARDEKPSSFKTTFSKPSQVRAMEKIVEREELDDLFNNTDLDRIASAVMQMFG